MKLSKNFKLLNGFNQNVLLECNTGKYYRIFDDNLACKLNNFFNYDIEDNSVKLKLESIKTNKNIINHQYKIESAKDFYINRLAMVLTSSCNLRCKYCYANYGMYDYKTSNNMTLEHIDNALDYFTQEFKGIKTIQFFGGEPSLCTNLIKYTINKFEKLLELKKIKQLPIFAIVTNAVDLTPELIELLKKYNIYITISIDGPKEVNDLTRVDINNSGSFDRIYGNYKKLLELGINNINIECTYTNEHIKQNISLIDLVEYFHKHFNISIPHIVPVCIEDENSLSIKNNEERFMNYVEELVDYTLNQLIENKILKSTSVILGILNNIITNNVKNEICPAGIGTFSISHDNKISPCFMYTSTENLSYGYIGENSDEILKKAYLFNSKFNSKFNVSKCKNCFAKSICSSCLGSFEIKNENTELLSNTYCNMIKIATKNFMLKISEIKSDTVKWNQFLNLIKGANCEK